MSIKSEGEVGKYKVRLVAKGFLHKVGLDYNQVFAPDAKIETIRLVIGVAIFRGWSLHQLDVKSAYLNGSLQEEVYVCQPPGFEVTGHENKVYKLKKALYGLKQVPRGWNRRIYCFLLQLDFNKCTIEYGVYVKATAENKVEYLAPGSVIVFRRAPPFQYTPTWPSGTWCRMVK
ncbi:hypothetical protein CR513_33244, partial [Mucuna pruriens]